METQNHRDSKKHFFMILKYIEIHLMGKLREKKLRSQSTVFTIIKTKL